MTQSLWRLSPQVSRVDIWIQPHSLCLSHFLSHTALQTTPTLTANSHISSGAAHMFTRMYTPHTPTDIHTHTHTYTQKASKAAIKPTQAFLLWILIHFSTQPASISLPYFPPSFPPSLYISISLFLLRKTIQGGWSAYMLTQVET